MPYVLISTQICM
uniref:Uncharacterized protein n=1 Tax=Pseudonaja textilis TaxID=8673 RepID=A0A670Y842_PSETE